MKTIAMLILLLTAQTKDKPKNTATFEAGPSVKVLLLYSPKGEWYRESEWLTGGKPITPHEALWIARFADGLGGTHIYGPEVERVNRMFHLKDD